MRWRAVLLVASVACTAAPSAREHSRPLRVVGDAVDLDPDPSRLEVRLVAEQAPDGAYRYSGQRPGPTLRATVGDEVVVHLENQLDVETTIHWHGVGVPNAMDGAPIVSGTTPPGGRFTYRFTVERAGTFWYHPHFDTARQVDRGLYGMFVVETPGDPAVEELALIFDDPDELERQDEHGHAKIKRGWTINGEKAPARMSFPRGRRVRARLLNASNTAYLQLEAQNMRATVIAGDQGLDGGPRSLPVLLGPGDRVEMDLAVEQAQAALLSRGWSLNGGAVPWRAPDTLLELAVDQPSTAGPEPSWSYLSEPPSPDSGRTDVVWTLIGSDRSGFWTINGEVFPNVTPKRVRVGDEVVVEVRNMSPTEHPFHIHGVPFEILSIQGRSPSTRTIEDTINVGIRQRVRLRLRATRPGQWMAHCHILPHADQGMMTLLIVEE